MDKRRILIVESSTELRILLRQVLGDLGHEVVATGNREEAVAREDLDEFDLIISDLSETTADNSLLQDDAKKRRLCVPAPTEPTAAEACRSCVVKAFKLCASGFVRRAYDREGLRAIVEKTLNYKLYYVDDVKALPYVREHIEFALPSDLSLMNGVLHYLLERVTRLGVIKPERSNLFIALDEAFVNAVKHGNKHDPSKLVRITADLSPTEARFAVEDEGEGFDPRDIPDPLDPTNLFKTSGRGVLLIYNIMDEVEYNERGNRLTMVKRMEETPEGLPGGELIEARTTDDIPARKP